MQAVVLAAGLGRRMQPISDGIHKALLPIADTTILGRIFDVLEEVGIRDATVVTGHQAEEVEAYLRANHSSASVRFVHNPRYAETNNIVSLSLALETLPDDEVLLIECDLLFDARVLAGLLERTGNAAAVDTYRTGMDGTVVSIDDGVVSRVFLPEMQGKDFSYADKFKTLNIYRFERSFCRDVLRPVLHRYATEVDDNCYYELVLAMLIDDPANRIEAYRVDGDTWFEVDDPNDLAAARFRFEPASRAAQLDAAFGGHWNFEVLDFSFMRNAHFPTDAMYAAMRHALPDLVGEYGSAQPVLNEKLGYFLACDPSRLQVLAGASQVYPILAQRWAGRSVALPTPTFGEYPRSFPGAATYPDRPGIDLDELDALAGTNEVVVVVNPNSPTGTTLPNAAVLDLARRHPQTTFLLDESFLAFSEERSVVTALEAAPLDNLVVLSSLSKSLGVPGLRLGYLYACDPTLVSAIGGQLPVWNLGSITEFFLELLLKFRRELEESLAASKRDREELRVALAARAVVKEVGASGGNFLLVDLQGGTDAAALRGELLARFGIGVKDVSDRFPEHRPRLRIGVRRGEENQRLLAALDELGAAPGPWSVR